MAIFLSDAALNQSPEVHPSMNSPHSEPAILDVSEWIREIESHLPYVALFIQLLMQKALNNVLIWLIDLH